MVQPAPRMRTAPAPNRDSMCQSGRQPGSAASPMLQVHGRYSSHVPAGRTRSERARREREHHRSGSRLHRARLSAAATALPATAGDAMRVAMVTASFGSRAPALLRPPRCHGDGAPAFHWPPRRHGYHVTQAPPRARTGGLMQAHQV